MRRQRRTGLTLFELLVVLAVLLLLFAMLLPALVEARVTAQRARGTENLKQLALALHNYHDAYGVLPPGVDDNHFSAAAKVLPFVEQENVFKQIDFNKAIDDKANADARQAQVKVFLSPRDPVKEVRKDAGATNYLFNDLVFSLNSKAKIPTSFPDGTSNTVVIGETLKGDGGPRAADVKRQYVLLKKDDLKGLKDDAGVEAFKDNKNIAGDRCASWMDGRFLQGTFNGRLKLNDERPDVSCEGAGGVSALRSLDNNIPVAMADGSVRVLDAKKLSLTTWKAALTPNGGEVLGDDW
jgi:type II secretory pathway pseudopilin PulG